MKTINLCGTWQLKGANNDRGGIADWPSIHQRYQPVYDAPVPGTVQEVMEFITGDVHLGHNVLNARFIEEQFWLYSRTFTLTEDDLAGGNRVRLVFEGLDLYAVIYVNGREVGTHFNFYTPCRLDVTDVVKAGENKLDVKLESGLYHVADKPLDNLLINENIRLTRRVYMRRPQSAFEWDWSPRLLNVGIFKPCRVEIAPFFADEISVMQTLSDDYSRATLNIRQHLSLVGEHKLRVEASIAETGTTVAWEGVAKGNAPARLTLNIENPRLWHPRGHGEQYRYTLTVRVLDKDGNVLCETVKKIGLRRVEVDMSPHPKGGRHMRVLVNGVRVFMRGGDFIPSDIIFSRLTRDVYETHISEAIAENFNALRVWGGGVYESDDFYELCDENGILVWQDFIGACATYPSFDKEFMDNYSAEVRYQLRRLSSYASLIILCGNNEIEQAFWREERYRMYSDANLYYFIIPRIMREEGDDQHYYQPSSPWSPDGLRATDETAGDQHTWSIGFYNHNHFGYRKMESRFPSEGGILGPTSLPCMMACLGEGQRYMHSFDFKLHDNAIGDRDMGAPEDALRDMLGIEIPMYGMDIRDYVYYGGFVHGEGLTEYHLNFRRRMNDTTSASIFWMFNDAWPATRSWTTLDFLRNRTPAYHPVRRAMAPVTVDIVREDDGFDIVGINDYLDEKQGTLVYGYATPDGSEVKTETVSVSLIANDSAPVAHLSAEGLPEDAVPFAELSVEGEETARRKFVEKPYHQLGLTPCEIKVTSNGDGTATYLADRLVLGVCLDLDGEDKELSDNFFDLFPNRPYTVKLGRQSGEVLYAYMGQSYEKQS